MESTHLKRKFISENESDLTCSDDEDILLANIAAKKKKILGRKNVQGNPKFSKQSVTTNGCQLSSDQIQFVQELNHNFVLLPSFNHDDLKLFTSKANLLKTVNKITIVKTNLPKFFLIDTHTVLNERDQTTFDAKNVFISSRQLDSKEFVDKLKNLLSYSYPLNFYVDCSEYFYNDIFKIFNNTKSNLIVVVSVKNQKYSIETNEKKRIEEVIIHYNFNDFTKESQQLMLQQKINFQGHLDFSILDLLSDESNSNDLNKSLSKEEYNDQILRNFCKNINDDFLDKLINESQLSVNTSFKNEHSDIHFEKLYQNRYFFKKQGNKIDTNNFLSEEKLLAKIANEKFFILSDSIGSGKTWTMKKFANILRHKHFANWVSYIDLKRVMEKLSSNVAVDELPAFIAKHILDLKNQYEIIIFLNLYAKGKVCLILDNFDIVPNKYYGFVSKLQKSFSFNGGNQLWFSTLESNELKLKEILKVNVTYKFNEFTKQDGINLIVQNWMLVDADKKLINVENDLETLNDSSAIIQSYYSKACQTVKKFSENSKLSIRYPNYFSILSQRDKTMFNNFESFIKSFMTSDINLENSLEVYQYYAMKEVGLEEIYTSIKTDIDVERILNVDTANSELLISKKKEFLFIHETITEFYVADFFLHSIIYENYNAGKEMHSFILFLKQVVFKVKKFILFRRFLNEFLDEPETKSQFIKKVLFPNYLDVIEIPPDIFSNNLENIQEVILSIFKKSEYRTVKRKISNSIPIILEIIKDGHSFVSYIKFLSNILIENDFLEIIQIHNIFKISLFGISEEDIKKQLIKIFENKLGPTYLDQLNVFNNDGTNILHNSVSLLESDSALRFTWVLIKKYFESQNTLQRFENLVMETSFNNCYNILHLAVLNSNTFETLCELLTKTFKNHKNMVLKLMRQKDDDDNNFLHLVANSFDSNLIESATKFLSFTDSEFTLELIKEKGMCGRNVLQIAATNTLQVFQGFWNLLIRNFSVMQKLYMIDFLSEIDTEGNHILHLMSSFSSFENVFFLLDEIEKSLSVYELRRILKSRNSLDQNILHTAALKNESVNFHEVLWKIVKKYFNSSEILEFCKHIDHKGNTILNYAADYNTNEVLNFVSNSILEIEQNLNNDLEIGQNIIEPLTVEDKISCIERNDYLNILINAVNEYDVDMVTELVEYGLDVNCVDCNFKSAVDYAYENYTNILNHNNHNAKSAQLCENILLCLLKANSRFPSQSDFNFQLSAELSDFVTLGQNAHFFVKHNLIGSLENLIIQNPDLRYFHNKNNKSAMMYAIEIQQIDILRMFSGQLLIRRDEKLPTDYTEICEEISKSGNLSCLNIPSDYMIVLKSKLKILSNRKEGNLERLNSVEQVLTSINKVPPCTRLLKLISVKENLYIYFDFNKYSKSLINTEENIQFDHKHIYIPAKALLDDEMKYKVITEAIYEICESSIQIIYMNNNNPYPMGESIEKARYEEILCKLKRNSNKKIRLGEMFKNVLLKENQFIVKNFSDFFTEIVLPELERTLPVLKKLHYTKNELNFNDLTNPMKAKIFNSKVEFQCEQSTLYDMIGNNEDVLMLISPEEIKKIIINNKELVIGSNIYKYLQIDFIKILFGTKELEKEEELLVFAKHSDFFIFSGSNDKKMSLVLKKAYKCLKQSNPSYYVEIVELSKLHSIIKKYRKHMDQEKVVEFLIDMVDNKNEFEKNIFENLLQERKVMLLFNGYDFLSLKQKKFMNYMFTNIKPYVKVQCIYTESDDILDLKTLLGADEFKCLPLTYEDIENILRGHFTSCKESDVILSLVKEWENVAPIRSPLLIRNLVEVFHQNNLYIEGKCRNGFFVIKKLIENQIGELENKEISSVDFDHIISLSLIQFLNFNLISGLPIIEKWNRLKLDASDLKVNCEIMELTGLLNFIISLDENNDKGKFIFCHELIPYFSISYFLIAALYQQQNGLNYQQNRIVFSILNCVLFTNETFDIVHVFLLDYIRAKKVLTRDLNKGMKKVINDEIVVIREVISSLDRNGKILLMWTKITGYQENIFMS